MNIEAEREISVRKNEVELQKAMLAPKPSNVESAEPKQKKGPKRVSIKAASGKVYEATIHND